MNFEVKQISSLEKIRFAADLKGREIQTKTVLAGERVSYQICIVSDSYMDLDVSVESELSDHIKLYSVNDVIMDTPVTAADLDREAEDYLSYEPGMMPDILIPLEEQRNKTSVGANGKPCTIWVRVDVPKDMKPGGSLFRKALAIDRKIYCNRSR